MLNFVQVLDVCQSYLGGSTGIPSKIAHLIYLGVRIIQVFVPILLIVWGMLDLGKAVMAQKDDEIKKGQQTFIKRLIAAVIVFFIVAIVKLVINLFADSDDSSNMISCIDAILKCNDSDCQG